MNKFTEYKLSQKTDELKRLIAENPDLPIVVLASEEATCGEWAWTFCGSISFGIEEILECDFYDYDDAVITDRTRLEEIIEENLYDDYCDKPEEEYDAAVKAKLAELEPHWTKVIAIYAGN